MKNPSFEVAIIGGGLSGLLISKVLSSQNVDVVLIDEQEGGGRFEPISTQYGKLDGFLSHFPDDQNSRDSLKIVEQALGSPISFETHQKEPLTFEKGTLQSFLGFGDSSPSEYSELSYYLSREELKLERPIASWVEQLLNEPNFEFLKKSKVTKVEKLENHFAITINAEKSLFANHVIYCASLADLPQLLTTQLDPKVKQKIAKSKQWTSIVLSLIHSEKLSSTEAIHLLMGTGETAKPCVGRFFEIDSQQASQWMGFLDHEESDEEAYASLLREIKRQIKRAYPTALDQLLYEKISVYPKSHAQLALKLERGVGLPGLENFWICAAPLSSFQGIVASLDQASLVVQTVLNSLKLSTNRNSTDQEHLSI